MNEKTEPRANAIHLFVREVKTCRQSNNIDDDSNIPMADGSYCQKDREIQEQTNIEEVKNKSFEVDPVQIAKMAKGLIVLSSDLVVLFIIFGEEISHV